ncbi:MAG: DUF6431 domain-containing protein [Clostridia bacterium]|nr:DUF6431 domain-containing protein [Clostridia bacterium]
MINITEDICPLCHGLLKYYDSVERIALTKFRKEQKFYIKRYKCVNCGKLHREIPDFIFPYKHYEKEIIIGVVEGLITENVIGFEDYPCDVTINRWKSTIDLKDISY